MASPRYALVVYVRNPVGQFVAELRRELYPLAAQMAAHLTILPPRDLVESEATALQFLEQVCSRVLPFDVELGDVETFLPATPTVFIQVTRAAYRLRELHDQLAAKALRSPEDWPYIPHLTIVKMDLDQQALAAGVMARERWSQFHGKRQVHVDELVFVREDADSWQDVASVPLGRSLLSPRP
jgi:2'-5' RNA ligase